MDSDFRRPQGTSRPGRPVSSTNSTSTSAPVTPDHSLEITPDRLAVPPTPEIPQKAPESPKPKKRLRKPLIALFVVLGVIVVAVFAMIGYYAWSLQPVDASSDEVIPVVIASGTQPSAIATQLKQAEVIRSETTFRIYTRLNGTQNSLQAGSYQLSKSQSLPEIVDQLIRGGAVESFDVTFLPGATLAQNRQVLLDAGYSEAAVDAALAADYDSPLFQGKPADADLEGYIYGETYRFSAGASVESILQRTFDQFWQVIDENNLVEGFNNQGLSLYEGIILASIIQREAVGGDETRIAQVFYSRLEIGMMLGADATYQYIADKLGQPRDLNFDSPYNTRRYTGIPPGPIATPGEAALVATATPADTDFLYFVHGDDDVAYFSRTLEEHEANVRAYCIVKCSTL